MYRQLIQARKAIIFSSRRAAAYAALLAAMAFLVLMPASSAQLVDQTLAPNTAKVGIAKSLQDEIGAGRGNIMTPDSSIFIIKRDPFRAVRRGRQLFQRKFTRLQGQGPNEGDGVGDINGDGALGAGLSDSCALCHGRPRGSAGAGGNVATRPDSRDAPHLFGLGLKEMLRMRSRTICVRFAIRQSTEPRRAGIR